MGEKDAKQHTPTPTKNENARDKLRHLGKKNAQGSPVWKERKGLDEALRTKDRTTKKKKSLEGGTGTIYLGEGQRISESAWEMRVVQWEYQKLFERLEKRT